MLMDPHPSQQRAGLHHTVFQLQKELFESVHLQWMSCERSLPV